MPISPDKISFLLCLFFATNSILYCQQQVLVKDFQVNESAGWCDNFSPQIAVRNGGSFAVVWYNYENTHSDIFMQLFDENLNRTGNAVLVNDDGGSGVQRNPDISTNSEGSSIVTWLDERSGKSEIFMQGFDRLGKPQGSNTLVSDTKGVLNDYSSPSVAMSAIGNFVITWMEYKDNEYCILAGLFDKNGVLLREHIKVNDSAANIDQYVKPDVSMDEAGNFIIVWEDLRCNAHRDIFARRFDFQGNRLGDSFKVNDDDNNRYHGGPSVSGFHDGSFVIAWVDERNYSYDIYAQRYDKAGTPVKSNFLVTDTTGGQKFAPVVSAGSSGRFVITWKDQREGGVINGNHFFDIFSQIYDEHGTPSGPNFKIQDDDNSMYYLSPAASGMDSTDSFLVAWNDEHTGNNQIYAKRFDKTGSCTDSMFQLNSNQGSGHQWNPVICAAESGRFAVAWDDYRNGNADVYLQGFTGSGEFIGPNRIVNVNHDKSRQYSPQIGMDSCGNFLVVWQDNRDGKENVYGQLFNSHFQPKGTNFKINENNPEFGTWFPKVAMNNNGRCIVAWMESSLSNSSIHAQRFDEKGNKIGGNFKVSDDGGFIADPDFLYENKFSVGISDKNNFVISWSEYRNERPGISFKLYNPEGMPIKTIDRARFDDSLYVSDYSMYMGAEGNFIISWVNLKNEGNNNLYAQVYDPLGNPLGSNMRINDIPGSIYRFLPPSISMNRNGDFCIVWQDKRNGNFDIYGQIYSASGQSIESNFKINSGNAVTDQRDPSVFIRENKLYNAWEDNSAKGQGWNIFANVILPVDLDTGNNSDTGIKPDCYRLFQNYPNPFNPATIISFSIPESRFVKLAVFDMLGKEVTTLVNEYIQSGTHLVQFHASSLPSGMYIYRIQAGEYRDSKKLLLLK